VPDIARPTQEGELAQIIAQHAKDGRTIEVVGGGSKRAMGRPAEADTVISMENLRGVTLYEPSEMVISAYAGTPLSAVETELDKHNQRLVFEPLEMGPMLGGAPGATTVGGLAATNLSGSRRIYALAARDNLLGIRAVNGRGEMFKSGGRVMKNVTGYDLVRGLAGSWGTLCAFTDVTFKALPKPEESRTLLVPGQPDAIAIELMCAAMTTPYEVSGAIHLQEPLAARLKLDTARHLDTAVTALRIENVSTSVAYRIAQLKKRFSPYGDIVELEHNASEAFWRELQWLSFLSFGDDPVWRISVRPSIAADVVQAISSYMDVKVAYDWSGGLIWLEVPKSADAGAADIRRTIATLGGHATLVRAAKQVRDQVEVFQPLDTGPDRLTRGLKSTFDPARVLGRGRMYAGV